MPNTTNFNWSTPADTDLVKNGASAIRTLGSAIDTSFVDFKGGTTGQVLKKTSNTDLDVEWGTASSGLTLINTTSFSAVSSQSVNDVFSATYENYRIVCYLESSAGVTLDFRLRVAGADNSTASSYIKQDQGAYGSTSAPQTITSNRFQEIIYMATTPDICSFVMELQKPFLATQTAGNTIGGRSNYIITSQLRHNQSTSYDGFTLIPSSGTITGKVSVYGYNF
jgi:hypothetical protein